MLDLDPYLLRSGFASRYFISKRNICYNAFVYRPVAKCAPYHLLQ